MVEVQREVGTSFAVPQAWSADPALLGNLGLQRALAPGIELFPLLLDQHDSAVASRGGALIQIALLILKG